METNFNRLPRFLKAEPDQGMFLVTSTFFAIRRLGLLRFHSATAVHARRDTNDILPRGKLKTRYCAVSTWI